MKRAVTLALCLLVAAPLLAGRAHAAECSSLPNPVYVAAGGNAKAFLKQASAVLGKQASPVTIVFQSYVSCVLLDQLNTDTKATRTASYWDAAGTETPCDIPAAGVLSDAGVSDVYAATCGFTLKEGLRDFLGPMQVMTFVTAPASPETAISAEAAYVALGFGGAEHRVAPWTEPDFMFNRPDTAGTKLLIAAAIGLPASKWKGQQRPDAGSVLASVASSTNPNATLGILTTELADAYRAAQGGQQVKTLAYKHRDQGCAYFPDSSSTSFDKRNVREGRYPMWGPFHLVARVDGSGEPVSPSVRRFVDLVGRRGVGEADKQSMTDAEIAAHAVPACAMRVHREREMEVPKPFTPEEPCGCYFDAKTTGKAACTACTSDAECAAPSPKCRFGYCEVR